MRTYQPDGARRYTPRQRTDLLGVVMSLFKKYARDVKENLGYRATWPVGAPIALGDVGEIIDGTFHRRTDLAQLGIGFEVTQDLSPSQKFDYESKHVGSTTVKVAGQTDEKFEFIAKADAGIRVEFTGEDAVMLKTKNARVNSIKDVAGLEDALLVAVRPTLDDDGETRPPLWKRDWTVIVEVIDTDATTVLTSTGSDAAIEIEAGGAVGPDGIVDVDAAFGFQHKRAIGVDEVAKTGATPLYRALRVKRKWYWLWDDDVVVADAAPPESGDDVFEDDFSDI